jgi:ParB-like chromosome segregation protein Spo0J
MNDPINNIQWKDSRTLKANDYNPNVVYKPELKNLEKNILEFGYVQPVIVTDDNMIIDGFHRVMLSKLSEKLIKKYEYSLPCVVFEIPRDKAMILTVRMNRAKGSHIAARMSEMVKELIDKHGWEVKPLARELGATKSEIELLHQDGVFQMRDIKNYEYSKAWYPTLEKNHVIKTSFKES